MSGKRMAASLRECLDPRRGFIPGRGDQRILVMARVSDSTPRTFRPTFRKRPISAKSHGRPPPIIQKIDTGGPIHRPIAGRIRTRELIVLIPQQILQEFDLPADGPGEVIISCQDAVLGQNYLHLAPKVRKVIIKGVKKESPDNNPLSRVHQVRIFGRARVIPPMKTVKNQKARLGGKIIAAGEFIGGKPGIFSLVPVIPIKIGNIAEIPSAVCNKAGHLAFSRRFDPDDASCGPVLMKGILPIPPAGGKFPLGQETHLGRPA